MCVVLTSAGGYVHSAWVWSISRLEHSDTCQNLCLTVATAQERRKRQRQRPKNIGEGLIQGGAATLGGFKSAVTGLVTNPIKVHNPALLQIISRPSSPSSFQGLDW